MKTRPSLQNLHIEKHTESFGKDSEEECFEILCSASTNHSCKEKKWSRRRKNTQQVSILIDEYDQNKIWTKEIVVSLAEKTGLSEAQIYKWGWDYKKKLKKLTTHLNTSDLICGEIIAPSSIDLDMIKLQNNYKEVYSSKVSPIPDQFYFDDI